VYYLDKEEMAGQHRPPRKCPSCSDEKPPAPKAGGLDAIDGQLSSAELVLRDNGWGLTAGIVHDARVYITHLLAEIMVLRSERDQLRAELDIRVARGLVSGDILDAMRARGIDTDGMKVEWRDLP